MGLGNPSIHERLRCLDSQLAAEVDQKTGKLICLRLATAEAKRLALEMEAEQQRRSGAGDGA
jgi:hypothetical protein